jgi:nucleoside-diphosphate-sugar epimerase
MRVFLAGGSGVVGRALIPQLVQAGHEVVATTRAPAKLDLLQRLGAHPVILDALDGEAVRQAVREARPEAVIHQLTALPARYEPSRASFYEGTNRLRTEGTAHLVEAAVEAGAGRFVFQSIAFMAAFEGPPVVDESARLQEAAPPPFGPSVRATLAGERLATTTPGLAGVVLRYGQLYGPDTYFAPEGDFGRRARGRQLPIVGDGGGMFSFLHPEDAAAAAVMALERGQGVYNVTDDEPAAAREWIPVFCDAVGAPRPLRIPLWLARLVAGRMVAEAMVSYRAASSARAKAELGWAPRHPSWRQGFYETASAGAAGSRGGTATGSAR